jgi:phosphoglycolate phosphatase-like HAD superfamily hydrolase
MSADMNRAVIFVFDHTLSPGTMFDPILKAWGWEPDDFWESCSGLQQGEDSFDMEHSYLYRLVQEGREEMSRRLDDSRLRVWGRAVFLYPGLRPSQGDPGALRRLKSSGANIFVVTGGIQALAEGCLFRHGLHRVVSRVFGCRMAEEDPGDGYGARLSFPKEVVNFTAKTQKLFAIKKGSWRPENSIHVNDKLSSSQKEIGFENMLYVGDGMSDVAAFATVNRFGGTSVAVYDRRREGSVEKARKLLADQRVHAAFESDYRRNSDLSLALEAWTRTGKLSQAHSLEQAA